MGTVSGTTHFKTIFSFSPGIDKNFIGKALCRFDYSVMHFIHILHLFKINNVFYTHPEERLQTSEIWRIKGLGNGYPCSYPTIRKLPLQKGTNTMEK
jgi:hypothetical protein